MPKSLYDFTVNNTCAANEGGCVSRITFLDMTMNVEEANGALQSKRRQEIIRDVENVADIIETQRKFSKPLAHNVIDDHEEGKPYNIGQGIEKCIIHKPVTANNM